jgi:hypothetical protein
MTNETQCKGNQSLGGATLRCDRQPSDGETESAIRCSLKLGKILRSIILDIRFIVQSVHCQKRKVRDTQSEVVVTRKRRNSNAYTVIGSCKAEWKDQFSASTNTVTDLRSLLRMRAT